MTPRQLKRDGFLHPITEGAPGEPLGRGTSGSVYKCGDGRPGEAYAVKLFFQPVKSILDRWDIVLTVQHACIRPVGWY
jgi:hypothetical protein